MMRYILYTAVIAILFNVASCNSGGRTETSAVDSTAQLAAMESHLDSIEAANNAIIAAAEYSPLAMVLGEYDTADMYLDSSMCTRFPYRFYCYAQPDSLSEKMLLISGFPNDVEGNPFGCKLGAYHLFGYDPTDNHAPLRELQLTYIKEEGDERKPFIKALARIKGGPPTTVYILRQFVEWSGGC